jgi:nitroreductase
MLTLPAITSAEEKDDNVAQIVWKKAENRIKAAAINDTLKHIRNRKSVRVYRPMQVKDSELQAVIQAGQYAAAGTESQSLHITVIQNVEMLEKMTGIFKDEFKKAGGDAEKQFGENPDFKIFYGAPTGIIVSGGEKSPYALVDCAAAVENMLIAAESLGLGTCWLQMNMIIFEGEKGKELVKELRIPDGYKPLYTFALGYKAEDTGSEMRGENAVTYVK